MCGWLSKRCWKCEHCNSWDAFKVFNLWVSLNEKKFIGVCYNLLKIYDTFAKMRIYWNSFFRKLFIKKIFWHCGHSVKINWKNFIIGELQLKVNLKMFEGCFDDQRNFQHQWNRKVELQLELKKVKLTLITQNKRIPSLMMASRSWKTKFMRLRQVKKMSYSNP